MATMLGTSAAKTQQFLAIQLKVLITVRLFCFVFCLGTFTKQMALLSMRLPTCSIIITVQISTNE